jgi:ABC-type multidrug transport system ATPase subunit
MSAPGGTAGSSEQAFVLDRVTRVFGNEPALVGASLEAERGETILVAGPNGAGKTTLLRILGAAIWPTYGKGTVLEHDLLRARKEIRQRSELIGHRTRLYADLTPLEYLRLVARLNGIEPASVEPALAEIGLTTVARQQTSELSHGMRQRVAVARALLRRPDLLLLDEPYASLDSAARSAVDRLITTATAWGSTVVVATHDVEHVMTFCDTFVRLDRGRIVAREGVSSPVAPAVEEVLA